MVMYRRYSLFMLYGKPFRTGLDSGWVKHCAERFVQQALAGDRFQRRLKRGVILPMRSTVKQRRNGTDFVAH